MIRNKEKAKRGISLEEAARLSGWHSPEFQPVGEEGAQGGLSLLSQFLILRDGGLGGHDPTAFWPRQGYNQRSVPLFVSCGLFFFTHQPSSYLVSGKIPSAIKQRLVLNYGRIQYI